jgi:hypothetical protein
MRDDEINLYDHAGRPHVSVLTTGRGIITAGARSAKLL